MKLILQNSSLELRTAYENLFSATGDGFVADSFLDDHGGTISNSSYLITNYIEFTNGQLFYTAIQGTVQLGGGHVCVYDSQKQFIESLGSGSQLSWPLSSSVVQAIQNAKYIRISFIAEPENLYVYNVV
jgi:hypothetical protein